MEELIRWIIIIVIIYSFLKGLFSKKKTEDKNNPSSTREIPGKGTLSSGTTVPQTQKRRAELTLEDILKRIPVEKPQEQKPPAKNQNAETYEYTDKYSENNPFDSPVDYDRGQSVSRETIIASKLKEKTGSKKKTKRELSGQTSVLSSEKAQTTLEFDFGLNLKNKLNQPETLREMFVISEILGKPKALRKW